MGQSYPQTISRLRKWSFDAPQYTFVPFDGHVPPFCQAPHSGSGSPLVLTATEVVTRGASPAAWKFLIQAGLQAGSVLSGTGYKLVPGSGGYNYQGSGPNACFQGSVSGINHVAGFPIPNSTPSSLADSLAREKLLGRYLSATKSWRGGNFLAEFRETVHMLRHPIQSLGVSTTHFVRGVHGIKHLAFSHPREYAKRLGNLWLAWSFGWKPLFDDIKDANTAIHKLASGTGHDTIKLTGNGSEASTASYSFSNASSPISVYAAYASYIKTVREVRYIAAFRARPESFGTVADTFGVDPYDLVPAVWEAIPWSFFIDYFLNVQGVIDSWRYASSNFAWGIRGTKSTVTRVFSDWYVANVPVNTSTNVAVSGSEASVTLKGRTLITSPPYVGFRFRVPGLGSLKWVNTSALIAQIAASKPQHGR